jgi:enoyl-CoA hydratase
MAHREDQNMQYETILVTREAEIASITFNRPKVLNALSENTMRELSAAIDELGQDPNIRCLILTGAGAIDSAAVGAAFARRGQDLMFKIENLDKPVIVAINGYALGGGCELAMACDIRIAADTAKLGQPEINLGIIPGYGGTQRLPRLVGKGRAKWLILTGDMITAQEALRIGLVDMVVPAAQLMDRAKELAKTIAGKAPLAVAWAKRSINIGSETDLVTACAYEASQFGLVCGTEDRIEGTSAFLEKRPPQFQGK